MSDTGDRWGWRSSLPQFAGAAPRAVRLRLEQFVRDAGPEQVRAWDDSLPWLQRECGDLVECHDAAREYTAILEYELPRDLRRPDVIVLEGGVVVVLELKGRAGPSQAALDQVMAYARDLRAYHAACADRPVVPVLVPSRSDGPTTVVDGVHVTSPRAVHALLRSLAIQQLAPPLAVADFLREDAYAPLPTIVQAARDLFHHRPLPFIKRARAATEPALLAISGIAHEAARTSTRRLVLLSGVPGSGKTLVGLQLVHAGWLDDLAVERPGGRPSSPAVYLSGNGPLVEVLQDALKDAGGGGRTFVQAIKSYVKTYSARRSAAPPEHLIVFDEAQRAHDAERFAQVHGSGGGMSEPDHLIEFAERIPGWCVLVGLIGTGQSIHQGEEGGLALWRRAIERSPHAASWTIHAAPFAEDPFAGTAVATRWDGALSLDVEIRYHLTPRVHRFVELLLDNAQVSDAATVARELHAGGHRFLVTRCLDEAKRYVRERFEDARNARFGIVASSKDKVLPDFDVDNTFQTTKRLRAGPWYNVAPDDPRSCCNLDTVATEFSSQGLELDFAILAWGSDLLRSGDTWSMAHSRGTRGRVDDPLRMRRNVYRVLLTRGRDGTVAFVPPSILFDDTYRYLVACGFRELQAV